MINTQLQDSQFRKKTTTTEVVHEIKLDDQNPITRQLIMFKNQKTTDLADYN